MTLATTRAAMAAALNTLTGVRATAYEPAKISPSPTSAWVVPVQITADTFEHNQTYTMGVVVCCGPVEEQERAQANLDALLETGQIQTALNGTLSGVVQSCAFQRVTSYQGYTIGGVDYIGATLEYEIYA